MSAPIKSWIGSFLTRHRLRFDCVDWPAVGTEANRQTVLLWLAALTSQSVTEAEADTASLALGIVPPEFRKDHIPALISMVEKLRQQAKDQADRSAPFARGQEQPPLPPPPGFKTWRAWVKKGCPDFELEDGAKKPAVDLERCLPPNPQPAGASTLSCRGSGIVPGSQA